MWALLTSCYIFDMQCNLPNCPLWSIFVKLNINQWEPHKDQLCKVCLNQTNSESYDAVWSKLLRMSKSQIYRKFLKGKICKHFSFEYHRLNHVMDYNLPWFFQIHSLHWVKLGHCHSFMIHVDICMYKMDVNKNKSADEQTNVVRYFKKRVIFKVYIFLICLRPCTCMV